MNVCALNSVTQKRSNDSRLFSMRKALPFEHLNDLFFFTECLKRAAYATSIVAKPKAEIPILTFVAGHLNICDEYLRQSK